MYSSSLTMAKKPVQSRIDEELKKRAEKVFDAVGIDASTAIRMFYVRVAATGEIPFPLRDEQLPWTEEGIQEAYEESFDEKNLSKPYENTEDMIHDLKLER
jgi:DNA-damage-inducible protein J